MALASSGLSAAFPFFHERRKRSMKIAQRILCENSRHSTHNSTPTPALANGRVAEAPAGAVRFDRASGVPAPRRARSNHMVPGLLGARHRLADHEWLTSKAAEEEERRLGASLWMQQGKSGARSVRPQRRIQ